MLRLLMIDCLYPSASAICYHHRSCPNQRNLWYSREPEYIHLLILGEPGQGTCVKALLPGLCFFFCHAWSFSSPRSALRHFVHLILKHLWSSTVMLEYSRIVVCTWRRNFQVDNELIRKYRVDCQTCGPADIATKTRLVSRRPTVNLTTLTQEQQPVVRK
jgi:hypothetical protein